MWLSKSTENFDFTWIVLLNHDGILCLIKWMFLSNSGKFSRILWGLCFSWACVRLRQPLEHIPARSILRSSLSLWLALGVLLWSAFLHPWLMWHTWAMLCVPAVFHVPKISYVSQVPPDCFPRGHFIKHLFKPLEEWSLEENQGTAWKSLSQIEILVLLWWVSWSFHKHLFDQAVVAIPKQCGQRAAEVCCV